LGDEALLIPVVFGQIDEGQFKASILRASGLMKNTPNQLAA
jgi:hypothetical protein